MNIIVAVDEEWGIGYQGNLLEKISEDMKRFKEKTIGKTVIMGRVTFESLPNKKPLINRTNIVLSAKSYNSYDKVEVCNNLEKVFKIIEDKDTDSIYIIGGAKIYELFLPFCKKAYITKIYKKYKSDRKMVNLDNDKNWNIIEKSDLIENKNGIKYQFITYEHI